MKVLTLIRGASGSGKSWLAETIEMRDEDTSIGVISADDYFTHPNGEYKFDPSELSDAHDWCLEYARQYMELGDQRVVVHNTFTRQCELNPYLKLAKEHGYKVQVITCEADFGNVHGVPEETVNKQRERFEHKITF